MMNEAAKSPEPAKHVQAAVIGEGSIWVASPTVPPASKYSARTTGFANQINSLRRVHQIRAVNRSGEYRP